jgi:DNA-binding CsgD family transcriptional regulator
MKPLTPRQHEIINGMLRGCTRKEIAFTLGISTATVDFHLRRLYQLYNAHSPVHLIAKLHGLVAA